MTPDSDLLPLLAAARAGDPAALARVLERYAGLAWKMAGRWGRIGMQDRDDLAQEAFLALAAAVRKFDPDRGVSFLRYAQVCIRRRYGRLLTRAARQNLAPLGGVEVAELPAAEQGPSEGLRRALALLTDAERRAVEGRYGLDGQEPLTVMQIAARQRVSVQNVNRNLKSAVRKLRGALRNKGGSHGE